MKPNGETVPSTGYRYMDSKYTKQTMKSMSAPGSYVGFEYMNSAKAVQNAYQISPTWNDAKLKGEFDTLQVIDSLYVPNSLGEIGKDLEPITNGYSQYGAGGYP